MKTSECCLAKCPEQRISKHIILRESKLTDQDVTKLLLAKLNFEFLIVKTGKNWHLGRFPFSIVLFWSKWTGLENEERYVSFDANLSYIDELNDNF